VNTSPSGRRIISLLIVVAVIALVWNFANPPASGQKGKPLTKEEVQRQINAVNADIKQMSKERLEMEPKIETLSSDKAADELIPRMIRDLQRIAKEAKVHLTEVKPQRPRPVSAKLEKVTVEVRLRAPFQPNAMQFFYLIEAPEGKMVVDKFTITATDNKRNSVEISANVTLFTRALSTVGGDSSNVTQK